MGNLAELQRCVPIQQRSRKYLRFFLNGQTFQFTSVWFGHDPPRVYKGGQGSDTHSTSKGYLDPPVPRQLVTESPVPGNLPTTYPDPLGPLPRVKVGGKHEVKIDSPAGLQFRRLPVRPIDRSGLTHSGKVGYTPSETKVHQEPKQLHRQTIHV